MRQTVIGVAELKAQFGNILRAFTPPQTADLMLFGAEYIAEAIRDEVCAAGLVDSGDLFNSVKAVKVNQNAAGVSVGVPYAAVHEYGLRDWPATAKQIRFFWAKYMSTGEGMWKALALKGRYTIPATHYFSKGVASGKQDALYGIMREAASRLYKAVMGR